MSFTPSEIDPKGVSAMQVAIIVVNYCTPQLTIDCLKSLEESGDLAPGTQVVVVDGGSTDDSAAIIGAAIAHHGWEGWATLLPLEVNGGFAYANNRGVEAVTAWFGRPRFLWLLNSDTVVRLGALSHLVAFMEANPQAAIAGSRLEDPDGTPQHSAFRFHSILGELESTMRLGIVSRILRNWCVAPPIPQTSIRTDWVSGASLFVRTEALDGPGVLDEAYFMYYEESDLCRDVARRGWQCWHVPVSRVVHLVGQSSGVTSRSNAPRRRPAYWFASRRRYFLKNHGWVYAVLADLAWAAGYAFWRLRRRLQNKPDKDPPGLLIDFLGQCALLQTARTPKF